MTKKIVLLSLLVAALTAALPALAYYFCYLIDAWGWVYYVLPAVVGLLTAGVGGCTVWEVAETGISVSRAETAKERAHGLLLRLLDPQQRAQYESGQSITVKLHDGYAAIGGQENGVYWHTSRPQRQCVAVSGTLVREDDLIAKLLWLRHNPRGLAAVSENCRPFGGGPLFGTPYMRNGTYN